MGEKHGQLIQTPVIALPLPQGEVGLLSLVLRRCRQESDFLVEGNIPHWWVATAVQLVEEEISRCSGCKNGRGQSVPM